MKKYRLAIVEDEKELLSNLCALLEDEGEYELMPFSDPKEALKALKENPPDALLTDISMPGMTGLELTASLREAIPDLPVVVLSAFVDFNHILKALRLGATDVLEKPYDQDQLLSVVAAAVTLGQARKKVYDLIRESGSEVTDEILQTLRKTQSLLASRAFDAK